MMGLTRSRGERGDKMTSSAPPRLRVSQIYGEITAALGNTELLQQHKIAFLCSRKIPASAVLKCYDWAIEQREKGNCVISGFHSTIEKDVFHYLLAGTQPVIIALARGMKEKIEPGLRAAVNSGRLLMITPFAENVMYVSAKTAEKRNRFMIELADEIVIGYASKGGMLERLASEVKGKKLNWIQK
jgi:predicted Rossmann fold nucleotide-binding protein DprA/Smf involved in DNA uptake